MSRTTYRPCVSRVRWAMEQIAGLRETAQKVEERMTGPDACPTRFRGVEWARSQIALHDKNLEDANALEARLEAALRPVFEALPVDEEGR